MTAFRDLVTGGIGARSDDARTAWRAAASPGLDAIRVDSRHIVRGLRRRPLFPLAVVSTLALAGGLTAVVFAILDTTLLRPLPYSDAGRLVSIGNKWIGFDHAYAFDSRVPGLSDAQPQPGVDRRLHLRELQHGHVS